MIKILEQENTIKIGREPMVILPLKKWEEIRDMLEDWEDAVRFNEAISDPENQKLIPLSKIKKKLNLP